MFASLHTSTLAVARVQSRARIAGLAARIRQALVLRAGRERLTTLDEALLFDIGMTREQALTEASRSVWDVPHGWRA